MAVCEGSTPTVETNELNRRRINSLTRCEKKCGENKTEEKEEKLAEFLGHLTIDCYAVERFFCGIVKGPREKRKSSWKTSRGGTS